ncbi:DNA-formamidopyrimidine glycosylase family protein [Flavobacterium kingsejongi]|uniref:Endonuclease n=1 Tax=Flavobacterium kingsejongi TaxID=1678728 RepID=A0A2S1LT92_9FLAO|nr:DNA-formamidopyrimidine glycosylase family protein [Flavobacterium kingsejongi]AWG26944.1 endonuclease [Flavobacterium kingsejongi]
MPEGPSIVILKEQVASFTGKKIISATGNAKIDIQRLENKKILAFKTWGKHFLICFDTFTIRIHLLLFGTYRINEKKDALIRLGLTFKDGEINFYTCSVKILEGKLNDYYDWSADVMNDHWDPEKAKVKLKEFPDKMICDILLEQDIFSGVGNIIKNEVLYRVRVHPETLTGNIPLSKIDEIIAEAQNYSFEFLDWKKKNVLKKHWLAHGKKTCLRCNLPLIKEYTGFKKRRSFFCENCQIHY